MLHNGVIYNIKLKNEKGVIELKNLHGNYTMNNLNIFSNGISQMLIKEYFSLKWL